MQLADLIEETKCLYAELTVQLEEIAVLQRNLENFLADYTQEIGPLCEALAALQPEAMREVEQVEGDSVALSAGDAKKLYHRLMKRHHPDTASVPLEDNYFFALAAQAYQQSDIATLTVLEHLYPKAQEERHDELLGLSERYDGLMRALVSAEEKKKALQNTPAYQLRQDMLEATLQGRDFMEEIKSDLQKKIHAAQQNRQLA